MQISRTPIAVMQSAKNCLRGDSPTCWLALRQIILCGNTLANTLMRSFLIEVCRVFSDHPLYMPAIMEENLIQTFSSQATHKPFTDPIGL